MIRGLMGSSSTSGLLWTVIIGERAGSGALWKSSNLALLFHDLQGWQDDDLIVNTQRQLDKRGNIMIARLSTGTEAGLKFVNSSV